MPFVLGANSVSGYNVTNSLRFNSGSSDKLTRTTGTPTSQQKFTWSAWCKKTNIGTYNIIQGFYTDANNYLLIAFNQDRIDVINYPNSTTARKITTAKLRDPSAWYHIVASVDTTLATSNDRIKLYINGTLQTAFDTNTAPSQNANLLTNATTTAIGVGEGGSIGYYDGYISEIYYIDGQQLEPSSFGETDFDTGIWKPKAYTGTYGTNGFYLQFKNSASLGTDSSGNGNTFTVNNLTSVDQSTDTPTNNFCTINPLFPQNDSLTFTNGNLQATKPSGTGGAVYYGNFGVSTGKWYWEMKCNARGGNDQWIGIGQMRTLANSNYPGDDLYCVAAGHGGEVRYNSVTVSTYTMASWTAGDIISIALDMDNSRVYWGKNGTWQDSGDPVNGTNPYTNSTIFDGNFIFPVGSLYQSGGDVAYNFGSPIYIGGSYTDGAGFGNFSYAVPSGYYALNTKNLATFG